MAEQPQEPKFEAIKKSNDEFRAKTKKELDELGRKLSVEIDKAFEDALSDIEQEINEFNELVQAIREAVPEDRFEKVDALTTEVTEWLQKRHERWAGAGKGLGTLVKKGVGQIVPL